MKQNRTLFVELSAGQHRHEKPDFGTSRRKLAEQPDSSSARSCFVQHYERIRALYRSKAQQPGVLAVAFGPQGLAASAYLAARAGRATSAIVGRHSLADIYLPDDPSLSLRHLALITYPLEHPSLVRYKLLDLRTSTAFTDENNRRLCTLEAEGPSIVRVGHYWLLLLFGGGDLTEWPDEPADGWDCIPDRVYFDDETAEPDRWERDNRHEEPPTAGIEKAGASPKLTTVFTSASPLAFLHERRVADDEEPVGTLCVRGAKDPSTTIVLGHSALSAGVLLGRAGRCDGAKGPFSEMAISRVHLLLVELDGVAYAIDTASRNGVQLNGSRLARPAPLRHGDLLEISSVRAEWRVVH